MKLGTSPTKQRPRLRQAARRGAHPRRRADAGPPLRHPAAGPARCRGGQGRAPDDGDSGRGAQPAMLDPEGASVGATFLRNNLNKRQRRHRPQAPEGPELFLELAPHFDVVGENFKAGTMDRLGPRLRRHRRTITPASSTCRSRASATGDSPYGAWPAYALVAEAMSGIYDYSGRGDEPTASSPSARSATSAPACSP